MPLAPASGPHSVVAPSLNVTVACARSPGAPSARSAIVARSTVLPELQRLADVRDVGVLGRDRDGERR